MQRKLILSIILTSIALVSFSKAYCSDEKERVISEQDADYLIKGVDTKKGKFSPDTPQTEKQTILSTYMSELNQLNMDTNKAISKIGPIEFSSFTELSDRKSVAFFKSNLKSYWNAKENHFNRMDDLLKKYRKQLGQKTENNQRLEGTAAQFLEKLEEVYVIDLNTFYDFVLQNHDKMQFTEEQIYLEDEKLVEELNKLWGKAVKSATELTTAQEMGTKVMSTAIDEYKKERNIK